MISPSAGPKIRHGEEPAGGGSERGERAADRSGASGEQRSERGNPDNQGQQHTDDSRCALLALEGAGNDAEPQPHNDQHQIGQEPEPADPAPLDRSLGEREGGMKS